jgi:hypothetical protein
MRGETKGKHTARDIMTHGYEKIRVCGYELKKIMQTVERKPCKGNSTAHTCCVPFNLTTVHLLTQKLRFLDLNGTP